jgi:hypothetical protein
MRRVVSGLAVALCLFGCSAEVPVTFPIAGDIYYTGGESCKASAYFVGLLMIDRTVEPNRLVVQDDQGAKTGITWRGWGYSFRMAGDEVEVVDGWTVVATSGGRYAIGGHHAGGGGFWACAGDVRPA